jgi:hypothetical protein
MEPVTSTLLRDLSPNWNNQPPRETALLDDCYSASDNYSFTDDDCGFTSDDASSDGYDFEHWLVVMVPPPGDPEDPDVLREEIIDSYIKTLSKVVGRYSLIPSCPLDTHTQMHFASERNGLNPHRKKNKCILHLRGLLKHMIYLMQ